jgi:hypothetical protein
MATSVGYHTVNIAEQYVHGQLPPRPDEDGTVATVMANLATAADRETVAALTKTIVALSEQLTLRDAFVKDMDAEIKWLTQKDPPP